MRRETWLPVPNEDGIWDHLVVDTKNYGLHVDVRERSCGVVAVDLAVLISKSILVVRVRATGPASAMHDPTQCLVEIASAVF
jgi:hypothetical protein